MEKILFEKEICNFLNLPSIPLKEWDNETPFEKGVAIIRLVYGDKGYAVARFNPEKEQKPSVVKVFGSEPFIDIEKVFIVPGYMETDVADADLDEESKKKAKELANEAEQIVDDCTGEAEVLETIEYPYMFDNITNDEEAIAFIEAYNKKNKIGGRVPKTHETILMRLAVIYADQKKASGSNEVENKENAV